MKWVKDYIDLEDENLIELATKVTQAGINIEAVISNQIDNLVIGEVKECIAHPDSDHLHICKVDIGSDTLQQIVCGASNVRVGLKVIVALPGAKLPGDFEIKAGKIRGVESNGMLCALFELGLEEKNEENYAKGIHELDSNAPIGKDPIKYMDLDDTLYDLDVHKHRNNDCYYHIGFAHEVGTVLGKKVNYPEAKYKEISDDVNNYINLKVETDRCPFYYGKMVRNVKIGESPEWIKKRIIAAGMRPINNVVDISNFVMLEYGQPTHFFDADKLGENIIVRDAKNGEVIITLDEQERNLSSKDIVIADSLKPICIAGVMGGQNTEIDSNTKNIFIEAAIFDAFSITKTSTRLNLKSEASKRYGKGLNYEYTISAMDRCLSLLEKYASGEVLSGRVLHDVVDKTEKTIDVTTEELNKVLGLEMEDKDVEIQLDKLDFPYELKDKKFHITIPRRRLDVEANKADLAEEIGRLYGYNNLHDTLPKVQTKRGVYVGDVLLRKSTSKRLRSIGLNETRTYTLVPEELALKFNYDNKELLKLPNPLSADKAVVRTSIIASLINTYEYNKARKISNIKLYEIAKTYDKNFKEDQKVAMLIEGNYIENKWNGTIVKADFYVMKGLVENLLDYLGFKNRYEFKADILKEIHPTIGARILVDKKPIGIIGKVHPSLIKTDVYVAELSLTELYEKTVKPIKFKEASKYPAIKKDVAFIVNNDTLNSELEAIIKHAGGRLLESVEIFDIYKDIEPGRKSMAYSLTFLDNTRTLSEEEVMKQFNRIIEEVEKTGAKLRDK
ncbi:MAG: phenylalanine--tRNA ligase subunit beta [Bacilli bacterium]|nr:phenylalanine--tRNA ligase subunit beta [Bacilli bacterium]